MTARKRARRNADQWLWTRDTGKVISVKLRFEKEGSLRGSEVAPGIVLVANGAIHRVTVIARRATAKGSAGFGGEFVRRTKIGSAMIDIGKESARGEVGRIEGDMEPLGEERKTASVFGRIGHCCHPKLANVVAAVSGPSQLSGARQGRQQHPREYADDQHHDQQLEQRETARRRSPAVECSRIRGTVVHPTTIGARTCNSTENRKMGEARAAIGNKGRDLTANVRQTTRTSRVSQNFYRAIRCRGYVGPPARRLLARLNHARIGLCLVRCDP